MIGVIKYYVNNVIGVMYKYIVSLRIIVFCVMSLSNIVVCKIKFVGVVYSYDKIMNILLFLSRIVFIID